MKKILIGHIDSGVSESLANFKGAIKAYRHFDYYGRFDCNAELKDTNGHGTMTAGLMLGRATHEWIGGAAQAAEMLVAVSIESGHRVSRVLSALMWMIEESVHIVNMSVGFPGWNPIFQPLIQILVKKGVLVVASIGNGGPGQFHSPGAYPEVLSVGAASNEGAVLKFSGSMNSGLICKKPDILGLSNVPSIAIDGNVRLSNTGTSGATAIVSGTVAQLMARFPNASAHQVGAALKATALPLRAEQKHRSINGLIQKEQAAAWLSGRGENNVPQIEGSSFFRDPTIQAALQFSRPESYHDVILYFSGKVNAGAYIKKTITAPNAIRSSWNYEKSAYFFVSATKEQIEIWWGDENILMISNVGC